MNSISHQPIWFWPSLSVEYLVLTLIFLKIWETFQDKFSLDLEKISCCTCVSRFNGQQSNFIKTKSAYGPGCRAVWCRGQKGKKAIKFGSFLTDALRVILFRCPWIWSYSKIKGQLTAVKRFVPVQFENVPPGLSLKKTSWVVSRRKSNLCILLLMTKSRSCLGFCIAVDSIWFIGNFWIFYM